MPEGIPPNNIVVDNPKVHNEPDAKMADGLTYSHIGTMVSITHMDMTINNSHTIAITINTIMLYLNLDRERREGNHYRMVKHHSIKMD
jgi:hypothetical protein